VGEILTAEIAENAEREAEEAEKPGQTITRS
jgi:hypothetical protein